MTRFTKTLLAAFAIVSFISACTTGTIEPSATQSAVDVASTYAAQTLEALASAAPTATITPAPTETLAATKTSMATETASAVPTEIFTATPTETPLPTSTATPTPLPTTRPLPLACNPDGVGISHIEISNFAGQAFTAYVSSENCFKTVEVAEGAVVTVAVPYAVYTVYGYIGTDTFFSVSGYVSDSIHTWFVRVYPDSAVMIGP